MKTSTSAAPGGTKNGGDLAAPITAPGKLSKPSTVALADMDVPQLAEAGQALDRAADLHENNAATCRVLHGLVLLEAKRKLAHGKFQPWLKKNFPASFRDAQRRMESARDFMAVLSDPKRVRKLKLDAPLALTEGKKGKSDRSVAFEAQQLLLADLASNLEALQEAKLDMANPVVAAASAYVGKRSWNQLLLDLGDVDGRDGNGGSRERPNGTKRRTAAEKDFDDREHTCLEWHQAAWGTLIHMHLSPDLTYQHLPDTELANVADILRTIAADAAAHCRLRNVVPSKLADWKEQLT